MWNDTFRLKHPQITKCGAKSRRPQKKTLIKDCQRTDTLLELEFKIAKKKFRDVENRLKEYIIRAQTRRAKLVIQWKRLAKNEEDFRKICISFNNFIQSNREKLKRERLRIRRTEENILNITKNSTLLEKEIWLKSEAKTKMDVWLSSHLKYEHYLRKVQELGHFSDVSDIVSRYKNLVYVKELLNKQNEYFLKNLFHCKEIYSNYLESNRITINDLQTKLSNIDQRYDTAVRDTRKWERIHNQILDQVDERLIKRECIKHTVLQCFDLIERRKNRNTEEVPTSVPDDYEKLLSISTKVKQWKLIRTTYDKIFSSQDESAPRHKHIETVELKSPTVKAIKVWTPNQFFNVVAKLKEMRKSQLAEADRQAEADRVRDIKLQECPEKSQTSEQGLKWIPPTEKARGHLELKMDKLTGIYDFTTKFQETVKAMLREKKEKVQPPQPLHESMATVFKIDDTDDRPSDAEQISTQNVIILETASFDKKITPGSSKLDIESKNAIGSDDSTETKNKESLWETPTLSSSTNFELVYKKDRLRFEKRFENFESKYLKRSKPQPTICSETFSPLYCPPINVPTMHKNKRSTRKLLKPKKRISLPKLFPKLDEE